MDWGWQLRHRLTRLSDLESRMELTPDERLGALQAQSRLAMAITPYFFSLIDREDPECPIRRQVIPRIQELNRAPHELEDPCGEDEHSPVPGLVHRYPDRVLFLVTDRCAAYCRYCTRSRLVSGSEEGAFRPHVDQALEYIQNHPEVRDVLISGGDPLLWSDAKLERLLSRISAIDHVEFIRIGSRIPVFLPQRITPNLVSILRKFHPLWLSIHMNHPREATQEVFDACARLADAGIPIGNQTVLLRGVNNRLPVMRELLHRLLAMRVRPYYIYQCDPIVGTAHLKTMVQEGIELMKGLRGHTSGYAIPDYVIDAPGGGGKIPITPQYVEEISNERIVLRNYEGQRYIYEQGRMEVHAANPV
jgi:lysine 2,3-aminomutase